MDLDDEKLADIEKMLSTERRALSTGISTTVTLFEMDVDKEELVRGGDLRVNLPGRDASASKVKWHLRRAG